MGPIRSTFRTLSNVYDEAFNFFVFGLNKNITVSVVVADLA